VGLSSGSVAFRLYDELGALSSSWRRGLEKSWGYVFESSRLLTRFVPQVSVAKTWSYLKHGSERRNLRYSARERPARPSKYTGS
jgi:hypothetical protein